MPYPYAHYFYLALIPTAAIGFAGYLSEIGDAGIAKHVHASAATLWILLLAAQSATIHNGQRRLHRILGKASLVIFPVYLAGFFLVYRSESIRIIDGDRWAAVFGPGIGAITLISVAATAYMFYSGLRERNNVQLHARWMLVTVFLFAESVLGRILNNFVPVFYINDLDDIRKIYDAFHVSQLLALVAAVILYARNRRYGRPFLFVIVALILQSIALELFDDFDAWRSFFVQSGHWPMTVFVSVGLILGAMVARQGWVAGRRGRVAD